MTDSDTAHPLCMWVHDRSDSTGSFHEHPEQTLDDNEDALRCEKESVIAFTEDGVRFHACRYHAPEDFLEEINIPLPQNKQREGRIQV